MQLTCIYLFHELPPEARRAVAHEMARVVKPGGLVCPQVLLFAPAGSQRSLQAWWLDARLQARAALPCWAQDRPSPGYQGPGQMHMLHRV